MIGESLVFARYLEREFNAIVRSLSEKARVDSRRPNNPGGTKLKRRTFLTAASSAAIAGVASPAIGQNYPVLKWRLQSSYPKSLDTLYGACTIFSDAVTQATDGRFVLSVFAAGELLPPLSVADGVQNGTVEMGHTGSFFYIGKDTAFAFGTAIPWGLNSRQHNAWFYHAGGIDILNDFYSKFGLFNLPAGNTGTQMGGWFRREIKSVRDLSGLRMRIGGLGGNVLEKLGVVPLQMSAGDTYTSLERGTIDAVEWVGPYDDERLGFVKIAPYYYYPSFWEGNSALSFFINLEKWNSLPDTYKNIIKNAAMTAALDTQAKYDALNPPALKRLVAAGAQLRQFPPDMLRSTYKTAFELYRELSEKNPNFKRIFDHQMAFTRDSLPYWGITDLIFDVNAVTGLQQQWDK